MASKKAFQFQFLSFNKLMLQMKWDQTDAHRRVVTECSKVSSYVWFPAASKLFKLTIFSIPARLGKMYATLSKEMQDSVRYDIF